MSRQFGEEGRRLSYSSYLRLLELLQLQTGLSEEHDELLFIVAHQAYELWFKVVLHELAGARSRIEADDIFYARHLLRRVYVIEKLLVEQIEVLETMSPQDFLAFRSQLAPASGFQSVQFREIEFLSGVKDPAYLARIEATPDEMNRLRKRLEEPSLARLPCATSIWIASVTLTSSTCAKRCSTMTRPSRSGAPGMCSWSRGRSAASQEQAAAAGPTT